MGTSAASEFPLIRFSDSFPNIGQNNTGQTVSNSLALFPSATWIKNRHTIHGGLDARFQQSGKNLVSGGNDLSVDRTWTQALAANNTFDAASGNAIATFLLGNLTSGSNTINPKTYFSMHYWAPFVQDDWKVTKRLTLNLGVRWDFDPAQTERNNYGNYAFNTTAVNPISSQVSVPGHSQLRGGLTFLGVAGAPRPQYALTKFNVQPRVGFAYAVNDRMVVRGGFGESYTGSSGNGAPTYGFSASTQYQAGDPTKPTNVYPNLANPISHLYPSVIQPHGSSLGLLEQLGQTPFSLNPNYKVPSFWTYSMGIEQQFGRSDTISIGYVGSRLYNGATRDNINHQDPAAFAPCNPDLGGRYEVCTNNNPANPFRGVNGFQGSNYYSQTTINALNFTRPFPQFGDMTEYQLNDGHTWYNSLQVTAAHKWNRSLTLHGTWTWSKLLDSGGFQDTTFRVAARQIDQYDRTHRVTVSGVYLLPVGRGRNFLGNTNRIVDGAIGGWELGSLFIYQTGTPYAVPGQDNQIASPYVHPYINPSNGYIRLVAPCVEQWKEDKNGNYSLQQLTQYDTDYHCTQPNLHRVPNSNFGPNTNTVYTGVRLPSIYQFDTNLSKNYQLLERLTLQVRIEAFNVLNHPLWSENPDTNFNDQTFGEITRGPSGQSNLPRQIQLSAKITW